MSDHVQIPAPLPYSFRCSCGALSVGTEDDPALFADHERSLDREETKP